MSERFEVAVKEFVRALARLDEALQIDRSNPVILDASIQRFEFTFEMAWRALKYAAADEGRDTASPRRALEAGYAMGLIDDDVAWSGMLTDRNETSHTYKELLAEDLYTRLPAHLERFKALAAKLVSLAQP